MTGEYFHPKGRLVKRRRCLPAREPYAPESVGQIQFAHIDATRSLTFEPLSDLRQGQQARFWRRVRIQIVDPSGLQEASAFGAGLRAQKISRRWRRCCWFYAPRDSMKGVEHA